LQSSTLSDHGAILTHLLWRGYTAGNYFLVLNAMLSFDRLDLGRKLDTR